MTYLLYSIIISLNLNLAEIKNEIEYSIVFDEVKCWNASREYHYIRSDYISAYCYFEEFKTALYFLKKDGDVKYSCVSFDYTLDIDERKRRYKECPKEKIVF